MPTANTSAQLLHGAKLYEVLQYYYSPSEMHTTSLYAFIGQVAPWENEIEPPEPQQSQQALKTVFKNMIASKLITSSDIFPVIPRIDWTNGEVYDAYTDTENMFVTNLDNYVEKRFYARNKFDQVFKCLGNNRNSASTVEPKFLPGTFDNTFLVKTADGYKWKFMYSLDSGIKQKFFDSNWMPVPIGQNVPNPIETFAAQGSIDVINISTVGQGYTSGGVTITITGDGRFANATPLVNAAGYLYDVAMSNTGTGYTFAETNINVLAGFSAPNVPAVAITPASPIGGHGFDPISELGCNHVMIAPEFIEGENGKISTAMTYRQIGLLLDPIAQSSKNTLANSAIYDITTKLFVSPGSGNFVSGEYVYQGANFATSTFSAEVVSFEQATNIVSVININGTPQNNQALIQDANGPIVTAVRTILTIEQPDFIIFSGHLLYIENRQGIPRSSDGTEQFRIVLSF